MTILLPRRAAPEQGAGIRAVSHVGVGASVPRSPAAQRSFPEYDWLKDLLQSGKSGTMFFSSAYESGGQLRKDGSRIFTLEKCPSLSAITQWRIAPRHPSTRP